MTPIIFGVCFWPCMISFHSTDTGQFV